MTGPAVVLITTFLASMVEAIEMVTIVLGVGATRGWRSTLIGVGAGFAVLAVVVAAFGANANQLAVAVVGGVGAVVITGGVGVVLQGFVTRIQRSILKLVGG